MPSQLRKLIICMSANKSKKTKSDKSSAKDKAAEAAAANAKALAGCSTNLSGDQLPESLRELFVLLVWDGVLPGVAELFRRPGKDSDVRVALKSLVDGNEVDWHAYNLHTCANVAKRYLLNLEGGVLGPNCEAEMLRSLNAANEAARFEILRRQLSSLPPARKQLLALMFGTWHLMVLHALKPALVESLLPRDSGGMATGCSEETTCSTLVSTSGVESGSASGDSASCNSSKSVAVVVESVSKAVCGSVFHTCREDPALVESAVRVMQPLTLHFSSGKLYESSLLDYFCSTVHIDVPPLSERVLGLGCCASTSSGAKFPAGGNACGPHLAPPAAAMHNTCAHNSSPAALCSSCTNSCGTPHGCPSPSSIPEAHCSSGGSRGARGSASVSPTPEPADTAQSRATGSVQADGGGVNVTVAGMIFESDSAERAVVVRQSSRLSRKGSGRQSRNEPLARRVSVKRAARELMELGIGPPQLLTAVAGAPSGAQNDLFGTISTPDFFAQMQNENSHKELGAAFNAGMNGPVALQRSPVSRFNSVRRRQMERLRRRAEWFCAPPPPTPPTPQSQASPIVRLSRLPIACPPSAAASSGSLLETVAYSPLAVPSAAATSSSSSSSRAPDRVFRVSNSCSPPPLDSAFNSMRDSTTATSTATSAASAAATATATATATALVTTAPQASSAMSESTHSGSTLRATSPPRETSAAAELSTSGLENAARANTMPAADAQQLRAPASASASTSASAPASAAGGMETETLSRSTASCAESVDVLWTSPVAVAAESGVSGGASAAVLYQRQGTDESLADNGPSKARARYGSDQWSTASAI